MTPIENIMTVKLGVKLNRSLLDSSIEMEFLVSDESLYFSHYACKMLRATDVACKSYLFKRKHSESSEIVVNHHF